MSTTDELLNAFIEAWNTGERPDVNSYLQQAAPADRQELADALTTWLTVAPTPDYDETALADIRADPRLIAALAEPVGARVAALRQRAGLAVSDLAAKVTAAFSLNETDRIENYLSQLESGELEENRLSRRLLSTLSTILEGTLQPPPQAAHASLFRADGDVDGSVADQFAVLSQAALTPAPEDEMDAVDRLFLGGPDA